LLQKKRGLYYIYKEYITLESKYTHRNVATLLLSSIRRIDGQTIELLSSSCSRGNDRSLSLASKMTRRRQKGDTTVVTNALVPGPDDAKVQRNPRPEYVPGKIADPQYVRVFDTTLRDGEQSPGATLTSTEKVQIATNLANWAWISSRLGFRLHLRTI